MPQTYKPRIRVEIMQQEIIWAVRLLQTRRQKTPRMDQITQYR